MHTPQPSQSPALAEPDEPNTPICKSIKMQLVGMGSYSMVYQISEDRVVKMPKVYPEDDNPDIAYSNFINRGELQNEIAIYERLGSHDGIIHGFKPLDGSIEFGFANQGDLEKYIRKNCSPSVTLRAQWIRDLVDAFCFVHSRNVVIQDIALRNILLHNNSIKLCDFGDSSLLPLGIDMKHFCESGTTPQVEILFVGCVIYSIATWKVFKYDYFKNECFPRVEDLPTLDDVLFADVIGKCWRGEYPGMEALGKDIRGTACKC